jgi:hypothetical protein
VVVAATSVVLSALAFGNFVTITSVKTSSDCSPEESIFPERAVKTSVVLSEVCEKIKTLPQVPSSLLPSRT